MVNINRTTSKKNIVCKAFFLNIRSLRSKLDEVKALAASNTYNFIILNEIWIKKNELQFFKVDGYETVANTRESTQGGGSMILIKKGIKFKVLLNSELFYTIIIEILDQMSDMKILTCYRTPSYPNQEEFLEHLESIFTKYNGLIGFTDSNIDLFDQQSLSVHKYRSVLSAYGMEILNNENVPTRITNTSATLIDHIWSDITEMKNQTLVNVNNCSFSDHEILIASFNLIVNVNKEKVKKVFTRLNKSLFEALVHHHINDEFQNPQTIDEVINLIQFCKEASTSNITKKVNTTSYNWITLRILNEIKKRERLDQKLKKSKQNCWLNRIKADELKLNNQERLVRNLIAKAKKEHFENQIEQAEGDAKKMWNAIKSRMSLGTQKKSGIEELRLSNGEITKNPTTIADEVNTFFNNIADGFAANNSRVENRRNQSSIFLHPITETETVNALYSMDKRSAPGPDGITVSDLYLLNDILSPCLTHMFNEVLSSGVFPEALKTAVVIPIFKSGDKLETSNYRPISLLPVLGKLLEKILNCRLVTFVNLTCGFDTHQFGFLKKSSTNSAILETTHNILDNLHDKKYAAAVFLDISKAFDSVNHSILIESLEELGIRGQASRLFKSYLDGRKIKVKNGEAVSSELVMRSGVPQGSVLGPTLYLLFITNIQQIQLTSNYTIYADDTCIVAGAKDATTLQNIVNQDLCKINSWLEGNGLRLNASKTVYMVFKEINKTPINIDLNIDGFPIQQVQKAKYLGIVIDEKLKWEDHITSIDQKINPFLGALRRSGSVSKRIAILIYNAFILSKYRYIVEAWSMCSNSIKDHVEVQLCRSLRIMLSFDRFVSKAMIRKNTQTLNITNVIKVEHCKLAFKIRKKMIKTNHELKTNEEQHGKNTRRKKDLHLNLVRSRRISNSTINSAISEYNALKDDLKEESSYQAFIKKINKHFMNSQS